MIQNGSFLKVIDNTGAKTVLCIKVLSGFQRRYAFVGDLILVSLKSLRIKRREGLKVKKGEIYKGLIVRSKTHKCSFNGDKQNYVTPSSIILLTKQDKLLGTRIFGSIEKSFRFSKYLKILSLADGISF